MICESCGQDTPEPTRHGKLMLCEFCAGVPLIDAPQLIDQSNWKGRKKYLAVRPEDRLVEQPGKHVDYAEGIDLASNACRTVGIDIHVCRGHGMVRTIVFKRMLVTYLLRRAALISYLCIAAALAKDHSTCINAVDVIERRARTNPEFWVTLDKLRAEFDQACAAAQPVEAVA